MASKGTDKIMALKEALFAVAIGLTLSALAGIYIFYPALYVGREWAFLGMQQILTYTMIAIASTAALIGKIVYDYRSPSLW